MVVVLDLAAVRRLAVDGAEHAVAADLEGVPTGAQDVVAVRAGGHLRASAVDVATERGEVDDQRDADGVGGGDPWRPQAAGREQQNCEQHEQPAGSVHETEPAELRRVSHGEAQQASRGSAVDAPLREIEPSHFFANACPACAVA